MNTKVDLIHVFNSAGLSCMTEDWYERKIAELERENARLSRLLKAANRRLEKSTSQ